MHDQFPEPLTPADCDLQDFKFMPLDVQRLRDSDLVAEQTPEENWAALLLWAASWHQVPAASLPDVDQTLAKFAGYVARGKIDKAWADVRGGAMRGFELCSDGRWYHTVVAEKANEAWTSKLKHAYDKLADRTRKANKQRAAENMPLLQFPSFEWWISNGRPPEFPVEGGGIPPENTLKGEGQGQGQGDSQKNNHSADPAAAGSPPAPSPAVAPVKKLPAAPAKRAPAATKTIAPSAEAWTAYADAYRAKYRTDPVRNAKVNGQLAQVVARLGAEEAPAVAAFFLTHTNLLYVRAMHPVDLLLRDCEKLRTEWATGRQTNAGTTDDRRDRQLATAALMTGAAPKPQQPEFFDVETRTIPA